MSAKRVEKITISKVSRISRHKIYGKCQAEIGNSSKGHAFAEYRKLKVLNQYKKLKHHRKKSDNEKDTGSGIRRTKRSRFAKMKNKYETAESAYRNKKLENERLKQESIELQRKRQEEFQCKQEKRRVTHQKLTKRTKRGQPIMANHIECLLEKIQKQ